MRARVSVNQLPACVRFLHGCQRHGCYGRTSDNDDLSAYSNPNIAANEEPEQQQLRSIWFYGRTVMLRIFPTLPSPT